MEQSVLQIILIILGVITSALGTVIISMISAVREDVKAIWQEMSENRTRLHKLELEVSERYVRREDLSSIIEGVVKGLRNG